MVLLGSTTTSEAFQVEVVILSSLKVVCLIEDEVLEIFFQFSKPAMGANIDKSVCQLCNKVGHEAYSVTIILMLLLHGLPSCKDKVKFKAISMSSTLIKLDVNLTILPMILKEIGKVLNWPLC